MLKDAPKPVWISGLAGHKNFITSFANTNVPCDNTATITLDKDNSILPTSNTSNTYSHYKIISTWTNSGKGKAASGGAFNEVLESADNTSGSNPTFSWPLPAAAFKTSTIDNQYSPQLTFGLFTSCLN